MVPNPASPGTVASNISNVSINPGHQLLLGSQPQTLAPGPVPSPASGPHQTLTLAQITNNTLILKSQTQAQVPVRISVPNPGQGRLYPRQRAQPQPEPPRQPALRSAEERQERMKERARAGLEGTRDHLAAMRCGTRPAGFGLLGPTLPASKPGTHSSPSPGLLGPRRARCRRAGEAFCRAEESRRPPPSALLRLRLQFHLRLPALLGFAADRCLSSLPTPPSFLSPPTLLPPAPSLSFLVLRCSLLSFPPSLLSPPPFPSLSLLTRAAFPDPAQARASALLRKSGGREPPATGKYPE